MSRRLIGTSFTAGILVFGTISLVAFIPVWGQEIESVTPARAFELAKEPRTYLVDVRSVAEYVLVGHPEIAPNVPLTFWSEDEAKFVVNPNFLEDLAARFEKEDRLIFICRSGDRSLRAAQMALKAGYGKVSHVSEGFEGDLDENGHRTVGGWKNSLPYTYKVDPRLAYRMEKR
jgi:rhodanese-related sulfurtransferase